MRASGVRDVLIYCRDHRCSHHVETNADGWAADSQPPAYTPPSPAIPGQRLGLFQRLGTCQLFRPQPPPRNIINVEILRSPAVRKTERPSA
jgi:hypothetical protein